MNRFRKIDIAARTADKLFQVVLPGTDTGNAKKVAEQFCKTVTENIFSFKSNDIHISCGCGISTHRSGDNTAKLLTRSRHALREAKNQGIGRVFVLG